MTISERIFKMFEEDTSKKQVHLARLLNVKPNTITNWKNGSTPEAKHLEKIAEFFGVSIDYLCTGKEYAPQINQGIFGDQNSNNTVNIGNGSNLTLSEMETELLKVFANLDIKRKTMLLSYAYELEKEAESK